MERIQLTELNEEQRREFSEEFVKLISKIKKRENSVGNKIRKKFASILLKIYGLSENPKEQKTFFEKLMEKRTNKLKNIEDGYEKEFINCLIGMDKVTIELLDRQIKLNLNQEKLRELNIEKNYGDFNKISSYTDLIYSNIKIIEEWNTTILEKVEFQKKLEELIDKGKRKETHSDLFIAFLIDYLQDSNIRYPATTIIGFKKISEYLAKSITKAMLFTRQLQSKVSKNKQEVENFLKELNFLFNKSKNL